MALRRDIATMCFPVVVLIHVLFVWEEIKSFYSSYFFEVFGGGAWDVFNIEPHMFICIFSRLIRFLDEILVTSKIELPAVVIWTVVAWAGGERFFPSLYQKLIAKILLPLTLIRHKLLTQIISSAEAAPYIFYYAKVFVGDFFW